MATQCDLHALVVGSGVAGPAMALFLQKAGISCAIYEAYLDVHSNGGGLTIAPNGMAVLDALGLAEQVIATGAITTGMRFMKADGKPMATLRMGKGPRGVPAVTIARTALQEILVAVARARNIPVHFGKRLVEVADRESGSLTIHFDDGSTATGDIVIGADGIHSRTRAAVFPGTSPPIYTGLSNFGGISPAAEGMDSHTNTILMFFSPRAFFGVAAYSQTAADPIMWWTSVAMAEPLDLQTAKRMDVNELKAHLAENYGPLPASVAALVARSTAILPTSIYELPRLPRWSIGRVVLVGDAAHAMPPHAGQGASMALEDAMYLARELRDRRTVARAFSAFEKARRERVDRVILQAQRNGARKLPKSRMAIWFKELMLKVFARFSERGQKWLYGYAIRWSKRA